MLWKEKAFSSSHIIMAGFGGMILLGTFLLMLPISSQNGTATNFLDALFTATSATCVTGLIVFDTATHWSMFGQLVILLLIQVGGMGVVTIAIAVVICTGRRIGLKHRFLIQEAISAPHVGGIVRLTGFIFRTTFLIEAVGALLLSFVFCPKFGFFKGIWYGIFHAISAFCNAGFDLMGVEAPFSSLLGYYDNILVNVVITSLIIVGGIGFFVWDDIRTHTFHFREYRLHTKLVLITTGILLVVPFLLFFWFEFGKDVWGFSSAKERVLASWFHAVSPRTAGFNTVDLTVLSEPAIFFTIVLMIIGGSSGSTAGGIKTTTIATLFLCIRAVFANRTNIQCFGRRFPVEILRRAVTIFTLYLISFLTGGVILCAIEDIPLLTALFETASAIATVGLSLGITPHLSDISHIVLILLMFFGRIGGLTLIYLVSNTHAPEVSQKPQESITIG